MTPLRRKVFTYVKLVFLIVLVGIFYWRDLAEIWQTTFNTGWLVFTLVIFSLIVVFLFQRRKPLKTLVLISESDNKRGAVFFFLALILYVIGSYTSYALWIHLCSLLLFVAAYLLLIVDRRIPRMVFLSFVALLLVVPPVGIEIFEVQNLLSLVTLYFITDIILLLLIVHILSASKWWKSQAIRFLKGEENSRSEAKSRYCPLCRSDRLQNEIFCPNCGRQRISIRPKPIKPTLTKFLILLLITLILSLRARMINWWNLTSLWTIHMPTLNEIYRRFKDIVFTAASVAGVFLLASWVRTNDDKKERLSDNAFFLLESKADLLTAVSMKKQRKFSGAELFEAYTRFVKPDMDLSEFYEKMNKLLKHGLLERNFVLRDCELRLIWKSRLP